MGCSPGITVAVITDTDAGITIITTTLRVRRRRAVEPALARLIINGAQWGALKANQ
jgi:hypothetical protein